MDLADHQKIASNGIPKHFGEALAYTGERMVPEKAGSITFWEHVYRYRFAAEFVRGKRVLDIACGEGYGTAALLKAGAASVVGVDVSEEACEHARRKYGINAQHGDAENIPLSARSVDVVISFETIEHVRHPQAFLDECARVLQPGGLLIISTPNKDVYSEDGHHNSFHCSEMSRDEFTQLLGQRFRSCRLYTQWPTAVSWWSLRSLAAADSRWLRIKGFERIRALLRVVLCRHIRGSVSPTYRQAPLKAILAHDRPLSALVNPYPIRKPLRLGHEEPRYIIAVARV